MQSDAIQPSRCRLPVPGGTARRARAIWRDIVDLIQTGASTLDCCQPRGPRYPWVIVCLQARNSTHVRVHVGADRGQSVPVNTALLPEGFIAHPAVPV
jgi:hypothetical protein